MIGAERIVAFIPARGGSKGIPRKNLADLGGHPLIAWSIACARRAGCMDRILVSTDDPQIAEASKGYGAELMMRDAHLATDTAGVFEVALDLFERLRREGETAHTLVALEPTAPFRTPEMIASCATLVAKGQADSAATFRPCHTHPFRAWQLPDDRPQPFIEGATPWRRRQDLPDAWEISGEVYAFDARQLDTRTRAFLHGRARAVRVENDLRVDIDNEIDLKLARELFPASHLAEWEL